MAVGLGLLFGLLTGFAAFFGAFMNMSFLLAGSASTNPVLFTLAIGLMLAWKVAGYYGVDRYLLPMLGTPWHPGHGRRQRDDVQPPERTRTAVDDRLEGEPRHTAQGGPGLLRVSCVGGLSTAPRAQRIDASESRGADETLNPAASSTRRATCARTACGSGSTGSRSATVTSAVRALRGVQQGGRRGPCVGESGRHTEARSSGIVGAGDGQADDGRSRDGRRDVRALGEGGGHDRVGRSVASNGATTRCASDRPSQVAGVRRWTIRDGTVAGVPAGDAPIGRHPTGQRIPPAAVARGLAQEPRHDDPTDERDHLERHRLGLGLRVVQSARPAFGASRNVSGSGAWR